MAETDLSGKTALITGAARRIGRAIALSLAREGVHVILHYRTSAAEALRLASTVKKLGVKAWTLAADFQKPDEYQTLIARAFERAGKLDILVNNASRFMPDGLKTLTLEGLTADIQTNAWVPFQLSREFARKSRKGSIVHLLDTRISGYDRTHVSYSISKRILAQFTALSALEFAPAIRVNAVAPGAILPPRGRNRLFLEKLGRSLPLQRHGDPQDVAAAVLFLLKSPFITGQIIYVDGGRHLAEACNG
jgi:hypothetical protein